MRCGSALKSFFSLFGKKEAPTPKPSEMEASLAATATFVLKPLSNNHQPKETLLLTSSKENLEQLKGTFAKPSMDEIEKEDSSMEAEEETTTPSPPPAEAAEAADACSVTKESQDVAISNSSEATATTDDSTQVKEEEDVVIKEENTSEGATGDTVENNNSSNNNKEDKKEVSKQKKKEYENWPLKEISDPHDHDVLYGRGGGTNHHPGNKRYRKMVEDKKLDYVNSKRLDKPLVALGIIKEWREQEPPGRFLKLDEKTGLWSDVGDKKAREKTSQALREKAPLIRKQQEEERMVAEGVLPDGEKSTRFAEGTKEGGSNNVSRPDMKRNTSLGPLAAENEVNLEGFSWQDGIGASGEGAQLMHPNGGPPHQPPPPPHHHPYPPPGAYPPHMGPPPHGHYRYPSHGSVGSMGPPAPPGAPYMPGSIEDRRMQFTNSQRYESWGSLPPPSRLQSGGHMQSGGSWGMPEHGMASRENSLGQFPLPHASIGHPAPYAAFDSRSGSYGPMYPPGPPPPPYGAPTYHYSSSGPPPPTSPGPYPHSSAPYPPPPPPHGYPGGHHGGHTRSPSNSMSVDPAVASAWSGQPEAEIAQTLSGEDFEGAPRAPASPRSSLTKPDIIKRATSNQNETGETKPDRVGASVKRAALNRDSSHATNRLKEICFPDQFKNGKFDATKEVNELSEDMHLKGRLSAPPVSISEDDRTSTLDYLPPIGDEAAPRPTVLDDRDRNTTLDLMAMDLAVKPKSLGLSSRSSTIEGLALDAVDDVLARPEALSVDERTTTLDFVMEDLQKPGTLDLVDRMTTTDFLQIVNEPLAEDDPTLFSGKRQAV